MTKMLENIPEQLLYSDNIDEDISIIIGENGCGKSTLLQYLANHYTVHRKDVVGIANSIHDKFENRSHNFHALRGRRGRRQTKETVRNAIINISKDNEQGLRNASRALRYIGYDPVIGFQVKQFHPDFERIISEVEDLNPEIKEILISDLSRLRYDEEFRQIIWFEMEGFSFKDVNRVSLANLFSFESLLKKLGIINSLEIFLSKNGTKIPLFLASSGELSLITSIIFLSTIIKERKTVILIDEPENSLHPKWQKEYVKTILDIFYYYQPKIIIATHSPMIVNGAEMSSNKPSIYKANNFDFQLQQEKPKNIEEMFYSFFEITTPENRFLSNLLVMHLNDLAAKKLDVLTFRMRINDIKRSIYDTRQFNLIEKVNEIAADILKN